MTSGGDSDERLALLRAIRDDLRAMLAELSARRLEGSPAASIEPRSDSKVMQAALAILAETRRELVLLAGSDVGGIDSL